MKDSKVMGGAVVKCLYELSEEENIRLLCEGREKYRMDMDCAREEGIERGLREGRRQGMKLGREEGEDEETIRVICEAASSFASDYDVDLIVESMKNVRCREWAV